MSNPFDQFDAPAAEGGNPFDQFDAPAAKKLPSKGILSDVGGAFVEGAKSAGRAIAGAANIYAGDEPALVEKAQAQESAQAQKPAALTSFNQAVTERVKPLGDDPGLLDSVKAIGGAVVDQPKGAGLAVVEQLPNAAPAIAGGMAGMKAGAALGTAIMPGVGTTIGAIGGGLAGMFLGNTAIETGYKGIEAAQDGAVTQDEMSRVKKEGAVKAGVITGVDALTLGLSKAVTNIPARAVESATRNALTKAGVNVADEAAVLAARQSPEISAAVRAAQESAFASANTLGKRAAAGGAALGLETVGEGLGEYLGELAATGKANVADAVLEAMMSLGQSGAEVAWGAARNKKAEQGGMWDTAEAKFQPPPPTLVTEPEPLQQRIDALMGIDTGAMSDKERTQYEKDLTAAFLEPVGVTQDEHGLEIPFTMADYLNAQVRAEDSVRARPLKQNAAQQADARLQQVADEEGYVAPEVPVVGTLSAMANMAIQSGAHKQSQMQQAMQAAVEKQKSTSEGSPRAAQPEQMATQAPQANDAQTPAFDVSTRTEGQLSYLAQNGQPGWREAATAEIQRRGVQISQAQQSNTDAIAPSAMVNPDAPAANSASVPALKASDSAKAPEIQNGDGVTNLPTEKRGIKTIDRWSAEELQGRLDRGNLSPESEQRLRAELAKRQPVKQSAPQASPLTVGKTPNGAEPVTVRNGVVHVGDYPAIDYETEADITVPEGATPQQIADALRNGGALGSRKIFGLKADEQKPQEKPAVEDTIGWTRMTTVEREALVAKAGWTGKTRGINLGGAIVAKQAWGKMSEANRAKLVAASQNPVKNESPDAATVSAEMAAPKQGPIKNQSGESTEMVNPVSQPKTDAAPEAAVDYNGDSKEVGRMVGRLYSAFHNSPKGTGDGFNPISIDDISAAIEEAKKVGITVSKRTDTSYSAVWDISTPAGNEYLAYLSPEGRGTWKSFADNAKAAPEAKQEQAPAITPQHVENGESEPATAAVVEQSLMKGAANSPLDLRQERDLLLKKVDSAIAAAPTAEEKDAWNRVEQRIDLTNNMHVADTIGYRIFDVPGDGKFKVLNLKEALQRFRERVETNPGFRKPISEKPKTVADWQKTGRGGTEATVKELLEDGEYSAAVEYAKQIGKPLVFGQYQDGSSVTVYTEAKPFERKGYDDFNMVSVRNPQGADKVAWAVVDLNSGLTISSKHPSRMKAIIETNKALDKTTPEQMATAVRSTKANIPGIVGTQEELEQRWLVNVEQREADAQAKADQEHRSKMRSHRGTLAETSVGKENAKKEDDSLAADIKAGVKNANDPESQAKVMADIEAKAAGQSPAVEARREEFTHNGVRIYPANVNVGGEAKAMWGVESFENKAKREAGERHGFGDGLVETEEQAKSAADRLIKDDQSRVAANEKRKDEDDRAARKKAEIDADTLNGFLDDKAPNVKALIRDRLAKQWRFDGGKVMTARERVESLWKSGELAVITYEENKIKPMSRAQFNRATQREHDAHEKKVREGGKVTVYLVNESDLGKTAYDYARHLIDSKGESRTADLSKNTQKPDTSPEPVKETAKNEQVDPDPVDAEKQEETKPVERSIADLQKALESAKFGERTELNGILIERVSEDAEQAIKQGEMPMYQTGQGTFVALHPSAQQDGMIQATRYSDTGVFGDSQYKEVKEAVRDNGLWFKRRLPDAEAARLLEQSIAAEAEYQERKNGASEPVAKAAEPAPADLGGQSKKVNASDEINMGGKISPNAGASEQSTEVKEPWMMTLDEILPSDAEISDDGNTGFADSKLYDYGNPDMSKLSDIGGGYSVAPVKGRDSILLLLKGEYRIGVYTGEFGIKAAYRSKGLATKLVKEAMRRGIYTPDESYSVGGAKTVEKAHKEIIREAIADGKQIPDEVLADYPDLKESGIALLSPSLGRVNADKVDIAVASKVVADLLSGWRNAPDSRVVATFDDLPAAVRKEIEDQGEKTARGVFHGDTFYLIADEHASANEIEETIFHEVWAHYGLRSMLGANTTRELAGVFDQISASGIMGVNGKDAFRAFARRNGFNTAQTESMLRKAEAFDPRFTEAMKKRILVEELIAKVQEKGDNPSLKRKAQEIIGAIREWLRKVGFSGLMKYSDADLMRLVQKARDTVKYGKRGSSGKGDVPSVLMTAWHGSPHDHDKFDSSKIGTGEGAQAYGYGHYFAGAKDVAEWYRRKLSGADNSSITFNGKQYGDSDAANRKLTNDVKKWAEETGRDPERIDVALEYLAGMAGDLGSARQLAAKEGLGISHWIYGTLNDLSEHLYPSPNGRLYQVELAPSENEYLDWDKPMSEQSEFVQSAIAKIPDGDSSWQYLRGKTIYKIVSDQYGSDKAASDYLHSIGIRGIRYLDGSSRSAGEGNSNYVIFNDADVSITAKYNIASKDKLTPADKAIYGMAAEGKSAAEVLKFIASASRSPFNRQVAKLLLKTGIAPSVTVGDGKGWKMNAGEGNKYAAGYNPKTDTISLFRPASSERNMLHELIHAATLKALSKKGMASAQMNALYQHVKKSGKLKGMYGMSDVDEFIAEAFSNPKFQAALKQVAAPSTSTAKSAWHWFVRVIKGILGLPSGSENALSQALEIGIGVMRENMRLNEGAGDVRYNAAPGKINQTDTEAFKRWFGDSAVVDSDGKPLRVFHGTASDITAFDIGRSGESTGNTGFYGAGAYFSEDADYASGFSFWARRSDDQAPNVVPVYLSLKNPAYINITPRSQAASEKSRATAEKIISTMIARGTDKAVVDKLQGFVSENKFEPFMGTLYNALGGGTGTTALLKEAGFDGVTIYGGISGKEKLAEAVAFDPTQIKSAIGNSGDFDATNPDIRYNVADEGGDIGRIVGDSVSDQLKAAVLRLSGRPMLDHTDPFAAENARLREQDQSLWSKAKKQLRRYLAPGGLLPQSVFAEKIKRDSEFQAVEFDVRHLIGGLEQAVKADFGIAFDKLSKEQMRPITEALAGKVPASLPEATKTAAVAMRQYIDGMFTEYLKIIQQKIDAKMLKALESGKDSDKAQAINEIELFEKIKGNIGRYVHRSYQAFDDPKWFEKVPAHVLNASRLYLKQGYMEAGENDAKASQMAEVTLHEILKNGTAYDSMESFIAESKLGAKDLSVLMRRKEVPAQIRALLGEYPDARLNFTKSATKMGRLIWNTRFLDRVRDMGMGSFFFEGKDRPPNATTQIAADGSEVYAPLNGLWTFPETAQAFKDALGKEQMSDLYRAIVRANGLVKYGKTVLAPTTAMRNWQSAMFFSLANGHFDLTQMKKSISAFREQVSQKATGQDLKYLRHLKQLGVVYDTPYAGEMARLMEDARMEELLSSDKGDAVRWFRKANQLAQGFYTFGDDFWKIIGFENEKAGLMKAGLSLQEAEIEAAKRIRDTYPTYSMVGRGIQWLSRFPLAGTFVSFPAEIIRTSGNMLRTVAADLKSDNPKLRELGMKRAAGMVFVSAAFYSLAALSMAMAGVGDDEDEAIRDLAPEWQKNSTFLYLGRDEKGNLRYFDMSFLDPYGYWKRPITAMLRNQPWEDSLASGLRGMLEPFIGADIAAKAIFEAVANQKENGGKVYKEKDGAINQTIDVADHLRKALQPGVVGNVERLVKAAGDVRKSSGQPYSMEDELVALVGWRATTIDPKTALYYRSFEFTDAVAEARKTITETLRDANEITPEDIADAKARAQAKQEQAFKEMHRLVSAAESAGMSKMQIVQTLRLSNISQANIGSLMRGETPDVSITPQLAARAVRQASQMRGPEYAAEVFDRYRQARAN